MTRPPEWSDPPGYDRALGRMRTPTDDFYDHRKLVLKNIQHAMKKPPAPQRKTVYH